MTKREQPWIVGMATLLAMVSNATVEGFRKSVLTDGLTLREMLGGQQYLWDGQKLFDNYVHYCLDYQGEDDETVR